MMTKNLSLAKKIIKILEKNAKTSDRKIAKQLNVSQSRVSRYRNFLEEQGVIKKYITIVDWEKFKKVTP